MTVQEQIKNSVALLNMADKLHGLDEKACAARRNCEALYRKVYTQKQMDKAYTKWMRLAAEVQAYYEETMAFADSIGRNYPPKPMVLEQ